MKVILSIKPQFAEKIFNGTKKFEFRRTLFKKAVTKIVVYASAPISRVIGEFEIDEILHTDLDYLWNNTGEHAGITREYYFEYFVGKEMGYAIKIKETKRYEASYSIEEKYGIKAPQSFAYIL
jgi:predicted transcriptional regulator